MNGIIRVIFLILRAICLEIALTFLLCLICGSMMGGMAAALFAVVSVKSYLPVNTLFVIICYATGLSRNILKIKWLIAEFIVSTGLWVVIGIIVDYLKLGYYFSDVMIVIFTSMLMGIGLYLKKSRNADRM